jgi:hypothetical protein
MCTINPLCQYSTDHPLYGKKKRGERRGDEMERVIIGKENKEVKKAGYINMLKFAELTCVGEGERREGRGERRRVGIRII